MYWQALSFGLILKINIWKFWVLTNYEFWFDFKDDIFGNTKYWQALSFGLILKIKYLEILITDKLWVLVWFYDNIFGNTKHWQTMSFDFDFKGYIFRNYKDCQALSFGWILKRANLEILSLDKLWVLVWL